MNPRAANGTRALLKKMKSARLISTPFCHTRANMRENVNRKNPKHNLLRLAVPGQNDWWQNIVPIRNAVFKNRTFCRNVCNLLPEMYGPI